MYPNRNTKSVWEMMEGKPFSIKESQHDICWLISGYYDGIGFSESPYDVTVTIKEIWCTGSDLDQYSIKIFSDIGCNKFLHEIGAIRSELYPYLERDIILDRFVKATKNVEFGKLNKVRS